MVAAIIYVFRKDDYSLELWRLDSPEGISSVIIVAIADGNPLLQIRPSELGQPSRR